MRIVNLWEYLPDFLKEFKELQALFTAETPTFQGLVANLEKLKDDAFIDTAGADGIAEYEKLLGISPSVTDTLEDRRATVLSRWWGVTPYTFRSLRNRIVTIQGNENVELYFDEDDPYLLHVVTRLEREKQINDLVYILQTMCPANMHYSIENISAEDTAYEYTGSAAVGFSLIAECQMF